ncbi:MAG: PEGA domain-containing protein [Candidatus Sulfotelmatobacter sp.]
MSTKIGHFEIQSELAKSATGAVYKANDPKTSQTVALKAIKLAAFGPSASELEKCLLAEAESTKVLSHPNLPPVFGAGEIDGQFFAAMEYIQGNSIATMLARKEGFSIWDILDIGRQVCSGLDHARSHNIFHFSLEPAKIMCGWDGTVRILGYGVSSVGKFTGQIPGVPLILHYMSPEQVRGEEIDARSNLFSLGTMFYEMVTDRKAFDGADAGALRRSILETTPAHPLQANPKLHPLLSQLIMKTLATNPAERYQSAKELLEDLEKCKESKPSAAKPTVAPAQVAAVPAAAKAAAEAKLIGTPAPSPVVAAKAPVVAAPVQPPARKIALSPSLSSPSVSSPSAPGAAAASARAIQTPSAGANAPKIQAPGSGAASRISPPVTSKQASVPVSASVPKAPLAPVPEAQAPKIAVDPMMAENGPAASSGVSFSEMTELPPLKEAYTPPPPATPAVSQPAPRPAFMPQEPAKPQIDAREVAENALNEIKNVPPRLMIYSIAGAAVVILIIAIGLVMHVNSLNNDGDSPRPRAEATAQPAPSQPAKHSEPETTQAQAAQPQSAQPEAEQAQARAEEAEPAPRAAVPTHGKNARKKAVAAPAPVAIPGQMAIDSTPQGAQVQVDGKTDPSWVTPFTLPGLAIGPHSVSVTKPGYTSDTRTVEVSSGSKSFVLTHLTQLLATLAVSSTPPGASVYVDGKDIGKLTPAQVSVEKGQHVVLVRKSGFLDETTNAQFVLGQTINFAPALRALGNVDDIKPVGKIKRMFGGKEAQGLATISVKTQPKGAQIAVNQHMLDRSSPVDFTLDPGNYMVDITLTGYAPIHKVVAVDKGGKAVIDEVLQRQ